MRALEHGRVWMVGIFGILLLGALSTKPAMAAQPGDGDISRQELLNFDTFLDSHQAIEQDLKKTPSLVTDKAYVSSHPELKTFLENHPGVREEVRENPSYFMHREERFDRAGRDITRGELQRFDNFLDTHQGIEQDIRKDPKLLNDQSYVAAHPELKEFLATHPHVSAEASENPRIFVAREQRFDKSGRDISKTEVKNLDEFLDSHPAVGRELAKNPSLANNPEYLAKHPEFKEYLGNHPRIQADLTEHPNKYMRDEKRYEKLERKQAKATVKPRVKARVQV
jgi:phage-related protein